MRKFVYNQIIMKTKLCIDCGKQGTVERRRCSECLIIYNKQRVRDYHKKISKLGIKLSRYGRINCCICNEEMIKNRPNQVAHGKCKKITTTPYNNQPRDKTGMMFGRRVVLNLGIKIPNKVIVHHIDENPINNSLKNLMIMSGKNHGKIHGFLREQRIINKGFCLEENFNKFEFLLDTTTKD